MLAEHGLNIEQQLPSTPGVVGYVVTDVPGADSAEVVEQLRDMPAIIRAHALLPQPHRVPLFPAGRVLPRTLATCPTSPTCR